MIARIIPMNSTGARSAMSARRARARTPCFISLSSRVKTSRIVSVGTWHAEGNVS